MHKDKNDEYLSKLLLEFNQIKTWTKRKKTLKHLILEEVDRLNLPKTVVNKNAFQLSRFGQTKNFKPNESILELDSYIDAKKSKQLICLGLEHCVFYWIAIREV